MILREDSLIGLSTKLCGDNALDDIKGSEKEKATKRKIIQKEK